MPRTAGGIRLGLLARVAACPLVGVLVGVLVGACDLQPKPDAKGIFDYIYYEPSPLKAAEMADNPYDANDRYRGTLLLANASFAGEPVYIALFERRIVDEDPSVRSAGARGLANHGEPRHVVMLVRALSDPDALVRREAARGLQRLHGDEAVMPLIQALKPASESDRDVRIAAATALGQYPRVEVMDALIAALEEDRQLAVNDAALGSLRTLTGQDFGISRTAWVQWRQSATDPFEGRRPYVYPIFKRGKYVYEYFPWVPDPPNEVAGPPVGLPRDLREPAKPENLPAPAAEQAADRARPQEPPRP